MKDYLYLNMDFLESFVAQQEQGLGFLRVFDDTVSSTKSDGSVSTTESVSLSGEADAGVTGGLNVLGLKADVKTDLKAGAMGSVSNTTTPPLDINTQTAREIIVQKQRENVFEKFLDFKGLANEDAYICSEKDSLKGYINEFVGIKGRFDYTSMSRLESLTEADIQDFYSNYSEKRFSMDDIQDLRKKLPYVKILLPFDCFLHSSGCMVFIEDEKHLRKSRNQIGYKFMGDNVTVVGKVCKCVGDSREQSALVNQMLDGIQFLALDILKELGIIKKSESPEVFLVSPIAIWTQI